MSTMRSIFRGVRPLDVLITLLLTALTWKLMDFQVGAETGIFPPGPDDPDGYRLDSNSGWMHFLLAAPLALLWWRRNAIAVTLFATTVYGLHDLLFGYVVRCGCGLPTAFVLAMLVGVAHKGHVLWWGFGATLLFQVAVLAVDGAAGLGIMPVTALMAIGLMAVGRVIASKTAMSRELKQRNEELRRLRDTNAALEVSGDRARLSGELDELLDEHLSRLEATASAAAGSTDPQARRTLLEDIEQESRATLGRMREIVGTLRGSSQATLSPAPSVDHLDALLARYGGGHVQVVGDPRRLPASVELSAYRIVEHLLSVLEAEGQAPVEVALTFNDHDLEVRVSGRVPKGAPVRDAILRARERASLQQGTLTVKLTRGRARAVAQLPVQS